VEVRVTGAKLVTSAVDRAPTSTVTASVPLATDDEAFLPVLVNSSVVPGGGGEEAVMLRPGAVGDVLTG